MTELVLSNQKIADDLDIGVEVIDEIAEHLGFVSIQDDNLIHVIAIAEIVTDEDVDDVRKACGIYAQRYEEHQIAERQVQYQEDQAPSFADQVDVCSSGLYARFQSEVMKSFAHKLKYGVNRADLSESDRRILAEAEEKVAETITELGNRFSQTTLEMVQGKRPHRLKLATPEFQPKRLMLSQG